MDLYISEIKSVTNKIHSEIDEQKWQDAQLKFNKWEKDKNLLSDYFTDPTFGCYYAQQLFESRLRRFHYLLKEIEIDIRVIEIIKNSCSITNFGCGPGPDVAAYVRYARDSQNTAQLHIKAIDQSPYWHSFVDQISHLDEKVYLTFSLGDLNEDYLREIDYGDVCIVSYPPVDNWDVTWEILKTRFSLVIVIDHAQPILDETVRKCGYQVKEFDFEGRNSFYYFVKDTANYWSSDEEEPICSFISEECDFYDYYETHYRMHSSSDEEKVMLSECSNGLHNIDKRKGICYCLISVDLLCGHSYQLPCNEFEGFENLDMICKIEERVICERGLHETMRKCGEDRVCVELIDIKLDCGHSTKMKCSDNEINVIKRKICDKEIIKRCETNMHWKMMKCKHLLICEETVEIVLQCGHRTFLKCNKEKIEKIKSSPCEIMTKKQCQQRFHEYTLPCHTKVSCRKLIRKEAACGHYFDVRCDDFNQLSSDRCEKTVVKTCANGRHKQLSKCSMKIKCQQKFKIELKCRHRRIFICNDINLNEERRITCEKISCRGNRSYTVLIPIQFPIQIQFPITKNVCGHTTDEICFEVCRKLLECGHSCQRLCGDCLNGRLHAQCLIVCEKIQICGHVCGKICHVGKCCCKMNCETFESQKSLSVTFKMSDYYADKWSSLSSSCHEDTSDDIRDILKKVTENLKDRRFSKKVLNSYKISYKNYADLLKFNNDFCQMPFGFSLAKYRNSIFQSLIHLLNWMDPANRNLCDVDLNDFHMEFSRIKHIFVIVCFLISCIRVRNFFHINCCLELLKSVLDSKYTENLKLHFDSEFQKLVHFSQMFQ